MWLPKRWMPALILFLSLVSSSFPSTSPPSNLSYILIYSLSPPLPCCFLFFLLPSSVYFPAARSALPRRILWYTNVSLTVLSVCLSSFTFPLLLLPVLSLRLYPSGLSTVFYHPAHLSCTCLAQCVVIQSGDTRRQSSPLICLLSMLILWYALVGFFFVAFCSIIYMWWMQMCGGRVVCIWLFLTCRDLCHLCHFCVCVCLWS